MYYECFLFNNYSSHEALTQYDDGDDASDKVRQVCHLVGAKCQMSWILYSYISEVQLVLFTAVHVSVSLSSPSCPVKTTCLQICWCWICDKIPFFVINRRMKCSFMCWDEMILLLKVNKLFKISHGSTGNVSSQSWKQGWKVCFLRFVVTEWLERFFF